MNKKEEFLKSLHSSAMKNQTAEAKNDKTTYHRCVTSPIRYAGGKSLAVGYIVERLPNDVTKVVSPFFGGGSVEIAMSKNLGIEVIGYDVFNILTNYWKIQIDFPMRLYKQLKELQPNQITYDWVKNELEDHWDKTTKNFDDWFKACKRFKRYKSKDCTKEEWERKHTKEGWGRIEWERKRELNPFELAAYYYFNFNLSYGPGFLGWSGNIYLNEKKYNSMLEEVRNFKPGKLTVECADFEDVFDRHPDDFFYCDPPYYIGENSKMFKGIYPMRNIPIHHNGFKHEVLAKKLKAHKGGFILSYNDCPQVKDWYIDFEQSFPTWQYTMGQGEKRMGKNRKERGDKNHVKSSHEIMIFCPSQTKNPSPRD